MTVEQFPGIHQSIEVTEDRVIIREFTVYSKLLADILRDAPNRMELFQDLIELGARARKLADHQVDEDSVRQQVTQLSEKFGLTVSDAVTKIGTAASDLLDAESGGLAKAMTEFKRDIKEQLKTEFSVEVTDSWMNKFDGLMKSSLDSEVKALKAEFDTNRETSALSAMKKALKDVIEEAQQGLSTEFQTLKEQLVIEKASKQSRNKQSAKGGDLENAVHDTLSPFVTANRDTIEITGSALGVMGTKKGDLVVKVNSELSGGVPMNIAIECKATARTVKNIVDELRLGMRNRQARVGLAIFDRPNAPTGITDDFTDYPDYAIVIVDRENPDENVLRYAYMWARWTLTRGLVNRDDGVDVNAIRESLSRVRDQLKTVEAIHRDHGTMANALRLANSHVSQLKEEVTSELDRLEAMMASDGESVARSLDHLTMGLPHATETELEAEVTEYVQDVASELAALPMDTRDRKMSTGARFLDAFPSIATSSDTAWLGEFKPAQQNTIRAYLQSEQPTLADLAPRLLGDIADLHGIGDTGMTSLIEYISNLELGNQ